MPNYQFNTKYFMYDQNNSGGMYSGARFIVIEALNSDHADSIAENKTDIYFGGCLSGRDCDCCGDRWSKAYGDGDDTILEAIKYSRRYVDGETRGDAPYILHADGRKEVVTVEMFNPDYWDNDDDDMEKCLPLPASYFDN